jgi:myo-inositol-1(or 4)-monophosphatase
MSLNLEEICRNVCVIARNTGAFIKSQKQNFKQENIEIKGLHNFVSYVDKNAEKMIVDGLKNLLPDAGFIAEEETRTDRSETLNWIIDPLDGTTNFIHGLPPFAVSIALMNDSEIIIGVIYEVMADECFYTWKGAASYLNGQVIHVSMRNKVTDSLIATGFPYHDYHLIEPFLNTLDYFMRNSHGIRRIGSAATDLAYVACARFEAFYEYSLCPWDVAAGVLIVINAGGKVSDFKGGNDYIFGKEIIASNGLVHEEFESVVKKIMFS